VIRSCGNGHPPTRVQQGDPVMRRHPLRDGHLRGSHPRTLRDSPATNDLPITMRLAEPPEPCEWLRSA
jgi:hypothetical protein